MLDVFAALQGTFLLQRLQVGIPSTRTSPYSSFREPKKSHTANLVRFGGLNSRDASSPSAISCSPVFIITDP